MVVKEVGTEWPVASPTELIDLLGALAKHTAEHIRARICMLPMPAKEEMTAATGKYIARLSIFQRIVLSTAVDLGIKDQALLQLINNAISAGSVHSCLLDDVIDSQGGTDKAHIAQVYLAHIMFGFYVQDWLALCGNMVSRQTYDQFLEIELETYSALFEEEFHHVGNSMPFRSTDLITHKCSPIKAVLLQVLRLANKQDQQAALFAIMEPACYTVCLMDDILDWEEDFDRSRFTYPIQAALDRLGIRYDANRHDDIKRKVLRVLCYSSLYHELMKDITDTQVHCIEKATQLSPHLASWIRECHGRTMAHWQDHVRFLVETRA